MVKNSGFSFKLLFSEFNLVTILYLTYQGNFLIHLSISYTYFEQDTVFDAMVKVRVFERDPPNPHKEIHNCLLFLTLSWLQVKLPRDVWLCYVVDPSYSEHKKIRV